MLHYKHNLRSGADRTISEGVDFMEEPRFIIRWPELNKQVRVGPIEHNRKLYDWFLENLPARCIQTTTVVAGLSVNMQFIRMNKTACDWIQEDMKLEYIHEWPCGRGFMFMTAGNVAHLCFKVDWVTEPLAYPTFCEVIEEDKPILKEVGWFFWEHLLMEKETFHVEFIREEDA